MEQYIQDFITYLREIKGASLNTLQAYHHDLKKLQGFLETQELDKITNLNETGLNSFILFLEKEGLSPSSVSRNIASIKAFTLYLLKKGILKEDPAERIKAPKIQKKTPQIIKTSLVEKLLNQPDTKTKKGIRDKAMLELLYATGMKASEIISLRISDINLKARIIICNEKKERVIPFGKSANQALQTYLDIRCKEPASQTEEDSDILFLNSSGQKLSRQGFWKIIKSYADMAGIENINPSSIRHSFAAHLIDNGADLESVKEFLGHSDIATTQMYLTQRNKNAREVYLNTHPRA